VGDGARAAATKVFKGAAVGRDRLGRGR
jgi:hypothetical protein